MTENGFNAAGVNDIATLTNLIALNVIRRRGVYHSVGNHAGAFSHAGHEPEVVIYHHLRHFTGPCKELFYSFRI